MISVGTSLLSDEIAEVLFCCDLVKCHGACCIVGDAGAPLEDQEIALLEDHLDDIKPFMTPGGIEEVESTGVFDYDADGKLVTPLILGGACAYICFDGEIARCAIEKAHQERSIPFAKPISCHLYPVRIKRTKTGDLLNYHKWHICSPALKRGEREKMLLYRFLEEALVRKYGKDWYARLIRLLR